MATTPPEQPTQPGPPPGGYQGGYQGGPGYGPGYGYRGGGNATRNLERYIGFGNPEFGLYVVVSLIMVALWAWAKEIEDQAFLTSWTAVTFAYLISRGIAKASRVNERDPSDTSP
ncbi:MAG: hypothetical protein M3R70_08945 [Actinomycetota bacterium]|nr:hypothetical protein [Actinomycetota bacterium]